MDGKAVDEAIASGTTYGNPETEHALFAQLRSEDPVHWTEPDGYKPFWTVTRHADVVAVQRAHEQFINAPRQHLVSLDFEALVKQAMGGRKHLTKSMHLMDGEQHTAYREITANWFFPQQVKLLDKSISALARRAIDDLERKAPECDFYRDIAVWYPLRVIMLILGLPDSDAPLLQRLTSSYFGGSDPEMQTAGDVIDAALALRQYFDVVAADRRAHPTDDVSSLIANGTVNGRPLEQYESASYYVALATAGHDTTSACIAGGVLALIQNPDQWQKLKENPSLIPTAVDEIIRWVSPIKHFFRTATQDCEVGETPVKAGDSLMMVYTSANRDELAFDQPFSFRVDRKPNRHVGFGYGVHMCLGMMLAKFEIQILLREMLTRIDSLELNGTPAWVESGFISGLKRLPISFQMKQSQAALAE
ncbi:cytochrome P450 [Paraburkholderia aspalathi]|uniref:Cytochrome P450 n=1 Tax=Paraburkholderia aspalathi TaxID=1324617 RepID=A0A1I7DBJ3_9BURK|nr:cytochrome P450 [Paraburkholderia aspalathi]SFU09088.1 Cytochrome P450 [Paraburkholderia aspalathi]